MSEFTLASMSFTVLCLLVTILFLAALAEACAELAAWRLRRLGSETTRRNP